MENEGDTQLLIEKIEKLLQQLTFEIDKKRTELKGLESDKEGFIQQQKELKRIEDDIARREAELQENIKLNRERTFILDAKEKKLEDEKERLQKIVTSI